MRANVILHYEWRDFWNHSMWITIILYMYMCSPVREHNHTRNLKLKHIIRNQGCVSQ